MCHFLTHIFLRFSILSTKKLDSRDYLSHDSVSIKLSLKNVSSLFDKNIDTLIDLTLSTEKNDFPN